MGYSIQTSQWRNRFSHDRAQIVFADLEEQVPVLTAIVAPDQPPLKATHVAFINRSIYYAIVGSRSLVQSSLTRDFCPAIDIAAQTSHE